ncbi:MAG: hypothetical protein ACTTGX_01855 [Candidatus Cryptobacteroides sp.]
MKKFIIGVLMALITFSAAAQNEVRAFEFEISVGISYPLVDLRGDEYHGGGLNLALRYNHKKKPIDFGIEIHALSIDRKLPEYDIKYPLPDLDNSAISFTTSYNFARGTNISPFIGIGVGISGYHILWTCNDLKHEMTKYIPISPRIGVEIGRHFRLTMDLRLFDKEHHAIFMRAGIVFGGGKKPIKNQAKNLF